MHERLAEADRAGRNRVLAAEQEAEELLRSAREEASEMVRTASEAAAEMVRTAREQTDRVRETGGEEADRRHQESTRDARDVVARAHAEGDRIQMEAAEAKRKADEEAEAVLSQAREHAERTTAEAGEASEQTRAEADERTRALLKETRRIAGEVKHDGLQVISDMREMSDSLRANAERLLRDVQAVHANMVRQIERIESERRSPIGEGRVAAGRGRRERPGDRGRGQTAPSATHDRVEHDPHDDGGLDVPEFMARDRGGM